MTKENLARANSINEQLETLNRFLEYNKKCWGILRFFAVTQINLKTSYGCYSDEITASKRLSSKIIKAVEDEISLLESELGDIGKE